MFSITNFYNENLLKIPGSSWRAQVSSMIFGSSVLIKVLYYYQQNYDTPLHALRANLISSCGFARPIFVTVQIRRSPLGPDWSTGQTWSHDLLCLNTLLWTHTLTHLDPENMKSRIMLRHKTWVRLRLIDYLYVYQRDRNWCDLLGRLLFRSEYH